MNYADALDQNQQSDRAWRLRRHLLSEEWAAQQPATVNRENSQNLKRKNWLAADALEPTRRLARTRLLITQRSGDAGLDALRELLRLDRDGENKISNAAMETAIGWLQDAGEYSAVRGHLWERYARSQGKAANRPLWAEISVALASDDTAALRPILEQYGERLPATTESTRPSAWVTPASPRPTPSKRNTTRATTTRCTCNLPSPCSPSATMPA